MGVNGRRMTLNIMKFILKNCYKIEWHAQIICLGNVVLNSTATLVNPFLVPFIEGFSMILKMSISL